jgi:S-disulfanyl-L-cysteine oxidoreductase SoxD
LFCNCARQKGVKKYRMKSFLGFALFGAVMIAGGGANAQIPGPFSLDQVDGGRKSYAENCAECHAKDLSGVSAPALAGQVFVGRWKEKTTADLYKFIQATMPMCHGGLLGNRAYAEIVAFLLWANGTQPGKDDFDGSAQTNIATIVTGTVRPDLSKSR